MPTQDERSAATRTALVAAGRRSFAEKGYAATSIEDVLREAGVSRGALYHHFASKDALFREVYEAVEADLTAAVVATARRAKTPLAQLKRGLRTFLERCLDPEVQQIALLDGPTVLGWEAWHEIELRYAFGLIRGALSSAASSGELAVASTDALAHLVFGAMLQAACAVAQAPDPLRATREMAATFDRVLDSLAR